MLARTLRFAALLLALPACGGADTLPPAAPQAAPAKPAARPESLPAGHLARADVDAALQKGPPWVLRRVPIEEVIRDGKFFGWRIVAMPAEWSGIDLKPGDVVTRVNGMTLEKPDDLFTAWTSLVIASDLKVAYERDGASREMVFHIDGDPSKKTAAAVSSDAPPPKKPRVKGTVVITEEPPVDDPGE